MGAGARNRGRGLSTGVCITDVMAILRDKSPPGRAVWTGYWDCKLIKEHKSNSRTTCSHNVGRSKCPDVQWLKCPDVQRAREGWREVIRNNTCRRAALTNPVSGGRLRLAPEPVRERWGSKGGPGGPGAPIHARWERDCFKGPRLGTGHRGRGKTRLSECTWGPRNTYRSQGQGSAAFEGLTRMYKRPETHLISGPPGQQNTGFGMPTRTSFGQH
ncbi:hypothetical protein Bbelb_093420 [Branchiostoma belcheri]|nr:hypothetical protein Bbelb_093420 [Branchiostoma belcheri]